MITMKEILKDTKFDSLPADHQANLLKLLEKLQIVREKYGKSMVVSSGYRSMDDHLRIYREKGITDKSKIPMKSNHLYGRACDVSDPKQELQKWVKANVKLMEELGLWMEDFSATKNWVHFQIVPPASGNRFFKP